MTKNQISKLEHGKLEQPVAIILHRTVSSSAASSLASFKSGVGTHFLVDTSGAILQTASLQKQTSHLREQGKSGVYDKKPEAPHNRNTIGIEVVGMPLDSAGKITMKSELTKSWQKLTPKQTKSVNWLVGHLQKEYNLSNQQILSHEKVQPKTKGEGETVKNAIIEERSKSKATSGQHNFNIPLPVNTSPPDATYVKPPVVRNLVK